MPNTTGDGKSYLESVLQMDKTTAADGTTFDGVHKQLLNNDTFLNSLITGAIQKAVNSGVLSLSGQAGNSMYYPNGIQVNNSYSGTAPSQYMNKIQLAGFESFINGTLLKVYGVGSDPAANKTEMIVTLDAAPASNVTPSLPGSARDDLVFLEAWRDATTGAWNWRIRVVDGVDFNTYPEGLSNPSNNGTTGYNSSIIPQGGLASVPTSFPPNATAFNNAPTRAASSAPNNVSPTDSGLYIAYAPNGGYNTADNYVYAIPLFRVRRRNSTAYDPDTNPMGGAQYGAYTDVSPASTRTPGQSSTLVFNTTSIAWQVGQSIYVTNNSSYKATITGISVGSTQTTVTIMPITSFGSGGNWANVSDRPDGLYSNIIDALDIIDLRHQIPLTGADKKALLELGMNKLLRGQLTTKDTARYAREYIGLNTSNYTDDVNTLLYCKFDGGINGTANGVTVTGGVSGGTPSYVNGVQGTAVSFLGNYSINWNIGAPAAQGEFEFVFDSAKSGSDAQWKRIVDYGNIQLQWWSATQWIARDASSGNYSVFTIPQSDKFVVRVTWNNGQMNVYVNGSVVVSNLAFATSSSSYFYLGGSSNQGKFVVDLLRVSNIVRNSDSLLPTGFSYANGDRILDGPNGDFNFWSDDVGGTAGLNGRTNPYGLSRVPNQVAARVAYNGSDIRHYYGQGVTPGWSADNGAGNNPTGSFENSIENSTVNSNESADGTKTTFTFNAPSNANGTLVFWGTGGINAGHSVIVGGASQTGSQISSASLSGSILTVTLATAPSASTSVQFIWRTGARHAHFIPATKGFEVHDWTDDQFTGDGTKTVFNTTKYNVTSANHVRENGAIQNGGYSTSGLNASTTLSAAAASGATTLTVASASNFVANQNIRIAKGDGTWYTTTVTSISGNTLTVPATTAALSQNATVQGAAMVTFTTAPTSGVTVDIVYESVKTLELGDYLRVKYQHLPYQGLLGSAFAGSGKYQFEYVDESGGFVTTLGTGSNSTPTVPAWMKDYPVPSALLPIGANDYGLKHDTITLTSCTVTNMSQQFVMNEQMYEPYSGVGNFYSPASTMSPTTQTVRGYSATNGNDGTSPRNFFTSLRDLTSAIPHLAGVACIVQDTSTGELLLAVMTSYRTDAQNFIRIDGSAGISAIDVFKLPGRPLIKGYGGVAA